MNWITGSRVASWSHVFSKECDSNGCTFQEYQTENLHSVQIHPAMDDADGWESIRWAHSNQNPALPLALEAWMEISALLVVHVPPGSDGCSWAIYEPSLKIETHGLKMQMAHVCCVVHSLWNSSISGFGFCASDRMSQMNLSPFGENHGEPGSKMDKCNNQSRHSSHPNSSVGNSFLDAAMVMFRSCWACRWEFGASLHKSPCPSHQQPLESSMRKWKMPVANLHRCRIPKQSTRKISNKWATTIHMITAYIKCLQELELYGFRVVVPELDVLFSGPSQRSSPKAVARAGSSKDFSRTLFWHTETVHPSNVSSMAAWKLTMGPIFWPKITRKWQRQQMERT